ncbi:MAG: cytochrome c oxidase subunit II [Actinomycetota bacterium]
MAVRGVPALLALPALLLAGCARNAPQDALAPVGEIARQADALFRPVFYVAVVIFFLVEGMLLYALLRFRQRSEMDAPVQVHGHTRLEVVWTAIPAIILAGVAVPTLRAIFDVSRPPTGNVLNIEVVAHQWWWEYRYPGLGPSPTEPLVTANEMHVPVGRPVYLKLKSDDVIHSFWVPKIAGKQDVIPGRENFLKLKADEPGTFLGQCAEFCGLSHSRMRLVLIAQPEEEFQAWAEAQRRPAGEPADPLARRGRDLFLTQVFAGGNSCSGCHAVSGTQAAGIVGPDLTHVASRDTIAGATLKNPEELDEWLRNPPKLKAGSLMPNLKLSEDQVEALVAYLKTLQ